MQMHYMYDNGMIGETAMKQAKKALGDPAELDWELREVHERTVGRDAWLAALPPVIFGLSLAILILVSTPASRLVIGGPTSPRYQLNSLGLMIGGAVVVLTLLVLAIGGMIAAVRRLPVWGYSWSGAAVMAVTFMLIIASDDKPHLVSPVVDVIIMIALLLLLGTALGSAGWRGPLPGGLAGLSTTMILSVAVVWSVQAGPFSRLDLALLTAPLGLLYGTLLYGFVTGPTARRVALLATGALFCLGTMWAVEHLVFWQWRMDNSQAGQIWILLAVGVALLSFGPLVGLGIQRLLPRTAYVGHPPGFPAGR